MKRIFFCFALTLILAGQGFCQSRVTDDVARLQALLVQASAKATPVQVLEKEAAVQINEYVFPLAPTTLVRCEKEHGKYAVKFFLQNGTAITRVDDPAFRRAFWAIELPSKQACREFITLFDQLRTDVRKS